MFLLKILIQTPQNYAFIHGSKFQQQKMSNMLRYDVSVFFISFNFFFEIVHIYVYKFMFTNLPPTVLNLLGKNR